MDAFLEKELTRCASVIRMLTLQPSCNLGLIRLYREMQSHLSTIYLGMQILNEPAMQNPVNVQSLTDSWQIHDESNALDMLYVGDCASEGDHCITFDPAGFYSEHEQTHDAYDQWQMHDESNALEPLYVSDGASESEPYSQYTHNDAYDSWKLCT